MITYLFKSVTLGSKQHNLYSNYCSNNNTYMFYNILIFPWNNIQSKPVLNYTITYYFYIKIRITDRKCISYNSNPEKIFFSLSKRWFVIEGNSNSKSYKRKRELGLYFVWNSTTNIFLRTLQKLRYLSILDEMA